MKLWNYIKIISGDILLCQRKVEQTKIIVLINNNNLLSLESNVGAPNNAGNNALKCKSKFSPYQFNWKSK